MNNYQKVAKQFQKEITKDINHIYLDINNEIELKMGGVNLLELSDNVIESSTAIGFCLEEFITKKLIELKPNFYQRQKTKTQNSSFDLYVVKNNIKILINLKVNKNGNNAIAAISQFKQDYFLEEKEKEKLFLIFKTNYNIVESKIKVESTYSFYFEQCNFDLIRSDGRHWSKKGNKLSGRMQYNPKPSNLKDISKISYKKTKKDFLQFIEKILIMLKEEDRP